MNSVKHKNNFKLDFIGIGVPRAATTWIWECLREHPELYLPPQKSIHFFPAGLSQEVFDRFKRYFKKSRIPQKKGMVCEHYYLSEEIARRIKAFFPDIKLIISLRNPVEALYSLYLYNKYFGYDPVIKRASFEEALELRPGLIEGRMYYKKIIHYFNLFPKENILVLIYKDLIENSAQFIKEIYKFLEIDFEFSPSVLERRVNPTPPKKRFFQVYGKLNTSMKQNKIGNKILYMLKEKGGRKIKEALFRSLGADTYKKPAMAPATRVYLQKIFSEDIKNLEKLINRDLSFWLD